MTGVAVAIAAVIVLIVPGLVITYPLRLDLLARVAVSGLASILALGIAGVLDGLLGVAWAPWHPLVLAVVGAIGAHFIAPRERRVRDGGERGWWIAVVWAVSAAALVVVTFAAVPDPARVSQTYDNVFHLSAVAEILAGGDPSSLTLRTVIQPASTWAYYPAGWHTLVASVAMVTGASVPVAANAAWIAVAIGLWMPGVTWLTRVLLPPARPGIVAIVALPLSISFAAMPYGLLTWGSLYPTFLATAILPTAIAVPIVVARRARREVAMRRWRVTALGSVAIAGCVFALAMAQPRVLASWALMLVPVVAFALLRLLRTEWRAGGARRRRAMRFILGTGVTFVVAAAAALFVAARVLGIFDRPLEDRLGGPQAEATQSIGDGVVSVLLQAWPTGVGSQVTAPSIALAVAVVLGVVFAAGMPRVRWIVVSYAAVLVLFALAAGSDEVVAKLLTGIWYKDRYRLSSLIPVLGVPLATLGILGLVDRVTARMSTKPWLSRVSAAASAAVAAVSCAVLAIGGVSSAVGEVFRIPVSGATTEVVSSAQIDLMRRLADAVPADQRVLGDPWDGSAWTRLYGGREPVFPHVNGIWDSDRSFIAQHLPAIVDDPAVCDSLDRLRVRFVLYSPHAVAGGDPAGNFFSGVHAAVEADLFTPVDRSGDTVLYRIDQCGPLAGPTG